ncbi:MAG: YceI family protein [Saprospiraceae bacterium]|nr:YceI family protein [Saprospiraceae bacterium]
MTKWAIDPTHSEVGFKVKHMMISTVKGHFESFDVNVETEGDDFNNAFIEVSIDVDSIRTKNADRDAHLKSDDFFNAEAYPQITFVSKGFNGSKLTGDLTIRNITKEVTLDVDFNGIALDPYGQTKAGFEITGEINRKEFGLKWDAITEAGSIVVSDKIQLVIDAQLIREA